MTRDNLGDTKCGFVALVGAPNAGKSSLLNLLIGGKVSIVTPKVQTTRTRITGICMAGQTQIVVLDTPGIFTPKRRLERAMVTAAWSGAHDADVVVVLVDAQRGVDRDTRRIIYGLTAQKRMAVLALNKIDTVKRDRLLPLAAELQDTGIFTYTYMISALKGDGVDDLRAFLAGRMLPGPWLYPEDQLSDIPLRLLAAEVTREKLFLRLHQELPYALTVETEAWEERKDGSVKIDQIVYVLRDSHKPIVLGKGGRQIKDVGTLARADLADVLGQPVHLFIHVKVAPKWTDDPSHYRNMGLEFPK
ncbi:MAG: GTPase Era [Pseudomonadota bacterium]|nr:GTPase Era [Pseudomonadota bacterium]